MAAHVYQTGMGNLARITRGHVIRYVALGTALGLYLISAGIVGTMPISIAKTNVYVTQIGQVMIAAYI